MAINLSKGQTVDLTKGREGLKDITIGLSWGRAASDVTADGKKKGFLARMFDRAADTVSEATGGGSNMDIDSSVVLVGENGAHYDTVYYGHQTSKCTSVRHAGDDLTGNDKKGEYDNEEIRIDLSRVPSHVNKLVFVANIFAGASRGQHFGQVKGAYIRVLKTQGREELIRYSLADEFNGMRGLVAGQIYRHDGEWKFRAIGEGTVEDGLNQIVRKVLN